MLNSIFDAIFNAIMPLFSMHTNLLIAIQTLSPDIFLILVGLLAVCVGSFINVVVYRLPIMLEAEFNQAAQAYVYQLNEADLTQSTESKKIIEQTNNLNELNNLNDLSQNTDAVQQNQRFNLSYPKSHCPHCGHQLAWYDNIPILGWLVLKGRCRYCSAPISMRYPLVELFTLLLSIAVAYTAFNSHYAANNNLLAFMYLVFVWQLITISLIDADTQLLPQQLTLFLIATGFVHACYAQHINAQESILACVSIFILLWSIAYIFKIIKQVDGMGDGDPYLIAGIAAWLGFMPALWVLFLAAILGLLSLVIRMIVTKQTMQAQIAFGPCLAVSGLIIMVIDMLGILR